MKIKALVLLTGIKYILFDILIILRINEIERTTKMGMIL